MAVLIEATSVVVPTHALLEKFSGGWEAFERMVPNRTLCADNEIVRVGFMTPPDVEAFVNKLKDGGLEHLRDNKAIDIATVDQIRGILSECDWLEFGHVNLSDSGHRVAACRLAGSQATRMVTPDGWKFENSLSSSYVFVPKEHVEKGMKFLRHEKGLDVYLNPITDDEMYVGRTSVQP